MSVDEPRRPDPDALLAKTRQRGKLKVFFGASAGVGKTYAMLQEAQRLRAQGLMCWWDWWRPMAAARRRRC